MATRSLRVPQKSLGGPTPKDPCGGAREGAAPEDRLLRRRDVGNVGRSWTLGNTLVLFFSMKPERSGYGSRVKSWGKSGF